MTQTTRPTSIGTDNGIGNIFLVDVKYQDDTIERIPVYAQHMQSAGSLVRMYAELYNFTILNMQ